MFTLLKSYKLISVAHLELQRPLLLVVSFLLSNAILSLKMSAEIESQAAFSFRKIVACNDKASPSSLRASERANVCVWKAMRKENSTSIRKILFTFFPICLSQARSRRCKWKLSLPPWKWKRKTFSIENVISPSFSMLNFHFRIQTERHIQVQSRLRTQTKLMLAAIVRCAHATRETSQAERKIAI